MRLNYLFLPEATRMDRLTARKQPQAFSIFEIDWVGNNGGEDEEEEERG